MLLSINPLVYYEDDFLTDAECETVIEYARDKMQKAKVCNDKGTQSEDWRRTGGVCFLPQNTNHVIMGICNKIASKAHIHPIHAEDLQVINYGLGEEYQPHLDAWDVHEYQYMIHGGQRTLTALAYLNDVEEGGSTSFPELGLSIPAKKGRIVFFENTHLGSNVRNQLALHGGDPVIKGEKWACNLWFREKHFQLSKVYDQEENHKLLNI